nr:MAG TPA: hypothetical protein [Caudoviricetes sp.]
MKIALRDFRQVGVISFCGRRQNVHFRDLAALKSCILWFLRLMIQWSGRVLSSLRGPVRMPSPLLGKAFCFSKMFAFP